MSSTIKKKMIKEAQRMYAIENEERKYMENGATKNQEPAPKEELVPKTDNKQVCTQRYIFKKLNQHAI